MYIYIIHKKHRASMDDASSMSFVGRLSHALSKMTVSLVPPRLLELLSDTRTTASDQAGPSGSEVVTTAAPAPVPTPPRLSRFSQDLQRPSNDGAAIGGKKTEGDENLRRDVLLGYLLMLCTSGQGRGTLPKCVFFSFPHFLSLSFSPNLLTT